MQPFQSALRTFRNSNARNMKVNASKVLENDVFQQINVSFKNNRVVVLEVAALLPVRLSVDDISLVPEDNVIIGANIERGLGNEGATDLMRTHHIVSVDRLLVDPDGDRGTLFRYS